MLVHNMFSSIEQLKLKATHGDMSARIKVEIYGLLFLLHEANQVGLGVNYLSKLDELSKVEGAWSMLTKAMWKELDRRDVEKKLGI